MRWTHRNWQSANLSARLPMEPIRSAIRQLDCSARGRQLDHLPGHDHTGARWRPSATWASSASPRPPNRNLLDFITLALDPQACAHIAYPDDNR